MAFLSYSHHDSEVAGWLHDALEEFQVPKRLVGTLTDQGAVPKRLTPIFRDRHELAAAGDLGEEIEEAIAGSRFLIVLCSPHAAQSRWIDEEIACFKKMHREDRILAAIIDGEPFASDMEGRAAQECFPPALRVHYDRRGRPTAQRAEPIAADLRPSGDGRHTGLLKLVAGLLGVGLDDLVQREERRRQKRLYAVTAASIAGMLFASGLAYTAIDARDEARDQRREADKLVGFMLGDLRQKLEPIGRLDVLDSVGQRALAYYEGQDTADLTDESLAQRSRALTLMGEMANTKGDLDGALRLYREAMAGTQEAAGRFPDDPKRLFDHAQNVFWVGYIDYQRGDLAKAERAFIEYRRLAGEMVRLEPANAAYQMERMSADSNLGTVLMEQRKYAAAADTFQRLIEPLEALLAANRGDSSNQPKLLNTLAWLADAREFSGHLDEATAHRTRQLEIASRLWNPAKPDTDIRRDEMTARRSLARLAAYRGDMPQALREARAASDTVEWLTRAEPRNTEWQQAGAQTNFDHAEWQMSAGHMGEAQKLTAGACAVSDQLIARDRSVSAWRIDLQLRCADLRARIALRLGKTADATRLAQQRLALARSDQRAIDRAIAVADSEMLLGDTLRAANQRPAATAAYRRALAAWPKGVERRPRELADRSMLLKQVGNASDARRIDQQLAAMGYRYPAFRISS
jgi:tetratricopeptide (TPR) repeat protein